MQIEVGIEPNCGKYGKGVTNCIGEILVPLQSKLDESSYSYASDLEVGTGNEETRAKRFDACMVGARSQVT